MRPRAQAALRVYVLRLIGKHHDAQRRRELGDFLDEGQPVALLQHEVHHEHARRLARDEGAQFPRGRRAAADCKAKLVVNQPREPLPHHGIIIGDRNRDARARGAGKDVCHRRQ